MQEPAESSAETKKDLDSGTGFNAGARAWLKPYQWKKGQSGNPSGRPKGTMSMKAFARLYLERMPYKRRLEFLKEMPAVEIWKMAEGQAHATSTEELTVSVPRPIDDIKPALSRPVPPLLPEPNAPEPNAPEPAPQGMVIGEASPKREPIDI